MTQTSPPSASPVETVLVPLSQHDRGLLVFSIFRGVIFSVVCVAFAVYYAANEAQNRFAYEADSLRARTVQGINAVDTFAKSLQSLLHASAYVDPDQFRVFTDAALQRHPFLIGSSYYPKVEAHEATAFEHEKIVEGYVGFHIYNQPDSFVDPETPLYPAVLRFPAKPDNIASIGWNVLSDVTMSKAATAAISDGGPIPTQPFDVAGQRRIEVFVPVYAGKEVPGTDRRKERVNGLVSVTFLPNEILARSFENSDVKLSYEIIPTSPDHPNKPASRALVNKGGIFSFDHQGTWVVGDGPMSFNLTLRGSVPLRDIDIGLVAVSVLIGVLLTISSYKLMRNVIERAGYVKSLDARNAELKSLSENLQSLVEERTKALAAALDQVLEEKGRIQDMSAKLTISYDELKTAQAQLVATAHRAGMTEVATGVLHNLGNLMNSINVSNSEIRRLLRESRITTLEQASAVIEANRQNLGDFMTKDQRGQYFPDLLSLVAQKLHDEHDRVTNEVERLAGAVALALDVIRAQQDYARANTFVERYRLEQLVEDALLIKLNSFHSLGAKIHKNFRAGGEVVVARNKLMNVLINLLTNAAEALVEQTTDRRFIELIIDVEANNFVIAIRDSGGGIAAADLPQIFRHGFTTKVKGHGFGLHSCANLMTELGGRLEVSSAGKGFGAEAKIILPRLAERKAKADSKRNSP